MKIGWIGLGKLGRPCAEELARAGHEVMGYDIQDPTTTLAGAVADREIVFIAVQTPHDRRYEGISTMPKERQDFEYGYLVQAVRDIAACTIADSDSQAPLVVAIVSTVLPGTCDRLLRPLLHEGLRLVYNPAFIRLESVADDFRRAPLRLVGADHDWELAKIAKVYEPWDEFSPIHMSIPSAELVKVAYNTILSQRIVMANALAEVCEGTGGNVDDVRRGLSKLPDLNMLAGMGDGGPCRPRDVIAMSWLAQRLKLAYDPWSELVRAREAQTMRLAEKVLQWQRLSNLRVRVFGASYKSDTRLMYGSAALLLVRYLDDLGLSYGHYDPFSGKLPHPSPALYVIAVPHEECVTYEFPMGSVVIDPWRVVKDRPGVTVVKIGAP